MHRRNLDMHRKREARERAFAEGVAVGRCLPDGDAPMSNYTMGSDYDCRFVKGFAFGQAETLAEQKAA